MKNILYQFIEAQTHFSMPRSGKGVWPSMNKNRLVFIQIQNYLQACTTSGKRLLTLYENQPMENRRGPTPGKKAH